MHNKPLSSCRIFTILVFSFLVGVAVCSFFPIDFARSAFILTVILFLFICAGLFNLLFKNYLLFILSLSLSALILGLAYTSFFEQKTKPSYKLNKKVQITGTIDQKPELSFNSQKVVIKVSKIDGYLIDPPSRVLVKLPHYPASYYGDSINLNGTIEKPGSFDQFDYGSYLKGKLIFGLVNNPENVITRTGHLSPSTKIIKILYLISDRFENSLNSVLDEPAASFSSGLLLGIKRNIPDNFQDALNATGLTHMIALSGYNITIIIFVMSGIFLGVLKKKQVLLLVLFLTISFVVLTGSSPSVVRAAIFSLLILFGKALGRKGDFTNLMLLAALVMVISNPFVLIYNLGFQLSFLAFAGLIYLTPILSSLIIKTKLAAFPEIIKLPLIETSSAIVAVSPLILFNFGRFSIIAPLANILILPLVPLAMALSFIAGISGIVFYPLGKIVGVIAWPFLELIMKTIILLAKAPLSSISLPKSYLFLLLYPLIALLAFYNIRKHKINYF